MRLRDEQKERALKEQAVEMVVREGFDGLSMHKLARAAGTSPATIYIYFRDREDLLLQVGSELMAGLTEATLAGFDPTLPFSEGLKVQWINRARYFLKYPAHMHFLEQLRFSPLHEKVVERSDPSFQQIMKQFLSGAISRGELVAIPLEVYWSVAFAPLYQLVKFHMHGKGMPGNGPFTLTEPLLLQTLGLVLKALSP